MSSLSPSSLRGSYDPGEQGVDPGRLIKLAEEVTMTIFRTRFYPKILSLDRADEQFGNISLVHRAGLLWNDADKNSRDDLPDFVVLKLPTAVKLRAELSKFMDQKALDNLTDVDSVIEKGHNAECNAYDVLDTIDGLRIAKHYGHSFVRQPGNYDGILVLEDLTKTTGVADFVDGLRLEQVYQTVDNLAMLHAHSLLSNHWKTTLGHLVDMNLLRKWTRMGAFSCKYFQTYYPGVFPYTDSQVARFLNPELYKFMTTDAGNPYPVILHGDLWTHNLLFRKNDQGDVTDELVAIIDWQSVHRGTIGEDLARLLAISTTTEFRRTNLRRVIARYYGTLQHLMVEKDKLVPFSTQDVEQSYFRALPYMAMCMTFVAAMQMDAALKRRSVEDKLCLVQRVADIVGEALELTRKTPPPSPNLEAEELTDAE